MSSVNTLKSSILLGNHTNSCVSGGGGSGPSKGTCGGRMGACRGRSRVADATLESRTADTQRPKSPCIFVRRSRDR